MYQERLQKNRGNLEFITCPWRGKQKLILRNGPEKKLKLVGERKKKEWLLKLSPVVPLSDSLIEGWCVRQGNCSKRAAEGCEELKDWQI